MKDPKKVWRTVRLLIEVPVTPGISETDVRWAVEQALDLGNAAYRLTKYQPEEGPKNAVGRIRVKSYSKVLASQGVK
jgi:hypothetical protein